MSLKGQLKSLTHRAIRPGLRDLTEHIDHIDEHAGAHPVAPPEAADDGSPKSLYKKLVYRAMRPALREHVEKLARIDKTLNANGDRGIWRGGLDGHAVTPEGAPHVGLSQKYGPELAYWTDLVNREAQRLWGMGFFEKCRGWQRARIVELAQWLEVAKDHGPGWDGINAWASTRTAVELGPGPMPSIAMTKWRRAIAIDPIADGYAQENLLPPECEDVVYMGAQSEHIPLPAGIADVVVMENALDHVTDPQATIEEISRLLKPDGTLWLLVDLMDYSDEMHPHPFSESRLRTLFRSVGLTPVRERVRKDGGCHPHAYGEYRALLAKIGSPKFTKTLPKTSKPKAEVNVKAQTNGKHTPAATNAG